MSYIAIVGEAEVVIRAIGNSLERDIQNALERGSAGARASGRDAGRSFGAGVGDGAREHDLTPDITPNRRSVDRIGEQTGRRLGNQIGKGVERSRMRGTIIKSLLKLNIILPVIGALVGGISTLVSGLFSIVAVAGNAASALIVLPGILSALGAGLVTTSLGFKGVGAAVAAGFDPSKIEQYQKALNNLPVAAQKFVKQLVSMRDGLKGIQAAAAEGLFDGPNGLTAQLKELEPLLPKIAGGFRATGQAVASGIGSAIARLTTDNAFENLGVVAATNNIVIRELGKTFGNFGATVLAVLGAASPVVIQFSEWMTDLTQRLRESSEAGASNGSLRQYFLSASSVAKVLIDIVKNLSEGLHDIGKISFPFGLDLLLRLREATQALADFTDKKENVDRLAVAFGNVHDNMLAISGLVKDLGGAFLRLGTGEGVGNIANAFRDIVPDIENLLAASLKTGPAIIHLVGSLAQLFATLSSSGVLSAFVQALDGVIEVVNFIASNVPFASQALSALLIGFLAFKGVSAISGSIIAFKDALLLLKNQAIATRIAMTLGAAANIAYGIATRAVAAAALFVTSPIAALRAGMTALNVAFTANPIGFAIKALVLLGAAFVLAWKKSETFRKIVVGMAKALITYFQFILNMWSKVLGALSNIPIIGKYADGASSKMKDFSKSLDGTKNSLDKLVKNKSKVDVDPKPAYDKLDALKSAGGFVLNGKLDLDTAEAAAKFAALAAVIANPITGAALLPGLNAGALLNAANVLSRRSGASSSGGGGGGGGAGESGSGNAAKEKQAKEKQKVDFKEFFDSLKKTGDDIRSAMDSLISSVESTENKAAIKIAEQMRKRAEPFLKALDTTADKIKKFGDRVKEVQQSLIDKANPFTDDTGSDFASIARGLSANSQKSADFANAVKDLRAAGLNNKLLQQFVQAGPDALAKAASILRSGPEGIAQLNKSISQVSAAGERAGKESAASTLNAGKLTADAFINGLIAQKSKLQKQLDDIATSFGQKIVKELGSSAEIKNFSKSRLNKSVSTPKTPAKAAPVTSSTSVQITQLYTGPTTGADRNKELDWTLRYSSPTAAANSAGGSLPFNTPVGVER